MTGALLICEAVVRQKGSLKKDIKRKRVVYVEWMACGAIRGTVASVVGGWGKLGVGRCS